ncbi:MAG: hypothetical protein HY924_10585 [Elusimicrobia bacterium]|nr:hypothetical protein [Elusimicrobiota bacterium]
MPTNAPRASFLAAVLLCAARAGASEFDFLPKEPGAAVAVVEKANAATQHGLSSKAAAVYNASLQRFVDALLSQKVFKPLRGARAAGYFRADDSRGPAGEPVPGFGFLRYYPFHKDRKSGKTVSWQHTNDEVSVRFNNPYGDLPVFTNTGKVKAFFAPEPTGVLGGYPTFKTDQDNEIIVLSRGGKLPWLAFTQEDYIRYWIEHWEKQAAESPMDPLAPEIVKAHKAALARMSPEERKLQARHGGQSDDFREPTLSRPDSKEGRLLVKADPAWFDQKLPRESVQLATLRFWYFDAIDLKKPGPAEDGRVSALRAYDTLHQSDWKAIAESLLGPAE